MKKKIFWDKVEHYLFRKLKKEIAIPIFVLIRSRPGDFVYTRHELKKMTEQISQSIDAGADGLIVLMAVTLSQPELGNEDSLPKKSYAVTQ